MITLKKAAAEVVDKSTKVRDLGRFVPNPVSRRVARAALVTQKNSPTILFAVGLTAGVATVVTACRATLQLEGVLEDIQSDLSDVHEITTLRPDKYSERDGNKMKAYIYYKGSRRLARLYGPTFVLGVTSVASLTGSHHILSKRNVALTAAYAALDKSFDEYRSRVVRELGEEKERDLNYGAEQRTIVEDTDKGPKKVNVKSFGDGRSKYARVWDETTSSAWKNNAQSNRFFIQCQQRWANDLLQSKGHVFLNDVHKMLGLEETSAGQIVGWVLGNGDNYIDFGIFDRQDSDERVFEFMFGNEKSVLLDFNVDGQVFKLLDELRATKD